MAQKDNFQKQVVQTLLTSGFKQIFEQQQHKEFIEMIAATYFTNELKFDGMIEYLADIVENQTDRKKIAQIIRDIKTPKVQVQPQPQPSKQNEQNFEKKPQKKLKTEYTPKPKQTKPKTDESKVQPDAQPLPGTGVERKGLKHELETSGKTKCRFFPFCKNPDTCEFFHPTEKCQYFPNCRYAENCLYVHEACRFKQKCTKLNCNYAHPGKRPANPLEAFMKSMMMGKNPGMFNKMNNNKKRPARQDAKEEEQQPEQ